MQRSAVPVATETAELDSTDLRLLRALEAEGRASFIDLGVRVGLSATAVQRRLRRLEEARLITGYGARIDHARLGLTLEAFIFVSLERQARGPADTFVGSVRAIEAIRDCWMLAGEVDFLLRVRTRDLAAFTRLMLDDILVLPGVKQARSAIVLDRPPLRRGDRA